MVMHSDGNIHDITFTDEKNWISDGFSEIYSRTEIGDKERFSELVTKGLYVRQVLKFPDAELGLIKFLYYNENEPRDLMAQENISVAWDGVNGHSGVSWQLSPASHIFKCDENGVLFGATLQVSLSCVQSGEDLPTKIMSVTLSPPTDAIRPVKNNAVFSHDTDFTVRNGFELVAESGGVPPQELMLSVRFGYEDLDGEEGEATLLMSLSSVATGVYRGSLKNLPEPAYWGDYFLYEGDNKTVTYADAAGNTVTVELRKGQMYKYDGAWKPDDSSAHYIAAFDDSLRIASSISETDTNAVAVFKRLTTSILTVGEMFSRNLTMMQGGLFKSANYSGQNEQGAFVNELYRPGNAPYDHTGHRLLCNGTMGWAFDYNGLADFIGVKAKDMTAENLTVNSGTFNNITINENGLFKGTLNTGSFWLEKAIEGNKTSSYIYIELYNKLGGKSAILVGSMSFHANGEAWASLHGTFVLSYCTWVTDWSERPGELCLKLVGSGTSIHFTSNQNEVLYREMLWGPLSNIYIAPDGYTNIPNFNYDVNDPRYTHIYCAFRY